MDELTKEIEEFGGKVLPLNSRKVANVGVVPIEGCPVTRTVDEVVTTAWVVSVCLVVVFDDFANMILFTQII